MPCADIRVPKEHRIDLRYKHEFESIVLQYAALNVAIACKPKADSQNNFFGGN